MYPLSQNWHLLVSLCVFTENLPTHLSLEVTMMAMVLDLPLSSVHFLQNTSLKTLIYTWRNTRLAWYLTCALLHVLYVVRTEGVVGDAAHIESHFEAHL